MEKRTMFSIPRQFTSWNVMTAATQKHTPLLTANGV